MLKNRLRCRGIGQHVAACCGTAVVGFTQLRSGSRVCPDEMLKAGEQLKKKGHDRTTLNNHNFQ